MYVTPVSCLCWRGFSDMAEISRSPSKPLFIITPLNCPCRKVLSTVSWFFLLAKMDRMAKASYIHSPTTLKLRFPARPFSPLVNWRDFYTALKIFDCDTSTQPLGSPGGDFILFLQFTLDSVTDRPPATSLVSPFDARPDRANTGNRRVQLRPLRM